MDGDEEITPEENEWMNAPMGDSNKNEEAYYKEILAVMYRWSQESDLTVGQWLKTTHRAIERIILK